MTTHKQFEKDFEQFINDLRTILFEKNNDYSGKDIDPFANLRRSERIGVPAWRGTFIRLLDKIARLESFARHNEFSVKEESFEDTVKDAANYLFLMLELFKENKYDKANKGVKDSS